jgi:hypothetical protein
MEQKQGGRLYDEREDASASALTSASSSPEPPAIPSGGMWITSDAHMRPPHTALMRQLSDYRRSGGIDNKQAAALKEQLRSKVSEESRDAAAMIAALLGQPAPPASPGIQVPEMPALLKQLSLERRMGNVSSHDARILKGELFSKSQPAILEAKDRIEGLTAQRKHAEQEKKAAKETDRIRRHGEAKHAPAKAMGEEYAMTPRAQAKRDQWVSHVRMEVCMHVYMCAYALHAYI